MEEKIRKMEDEGVWKWVLMKETHEKFDGDETAFLHAFKVLK